MKTILFTQIDDYHIVVGFDAQQINRVATLKKVEELITETEEFRAVTEIQTKCHGALLRINELSVEAHTAKMQGLSEQLAHAESEYLKAKAKHELLAEEFSEKTAQLHKKREELAQTHCVYFDLPQNEKAVLNEEYDTLYTKFVELEAHQLLTVSGSIIEDYRGVQYVKDDMLTTITKIGASPDGTLYEELEQEEKERLRILQLSDEEKETEYQSAVEMAENQAVTLRQKLELRRTSAEDALTQSQEWLDAEIVQLHEKYGILPEKGSIEE